MVFVPNLFIVEQCTNWNKELKDYQNKAVKYRYIGLLQVYSRVS